jgi:hypothetical protein
MEKLALILEDLVRRAQDKPGIPQRYTLNHDLRVDVLMHHGRTTLQISRAAEFPTVEEYQNILHHWPIPVEWSDPVPVAHSGRKYLTGDWLKPTVPFK